MFLPSQPKPLKTCASVSIEPGLTVGLERVKPAAWTATAPAARNAAVRILCMDETSSGWDADDGANGAAVPSPGTPRRAGAGGGPPVGTGRMVLGRGLCFTRGSVPRGAAMTPSVPPLLRPLVAGLGLAALLGACATSSTPESGAAIAARAAKAMGADTLTTLRYSGEGTGYTFGQAYVPGGAWPKI